MITQARTRLDASPIADWLNVAATDRRDVWKIDFEDRHLGNPLIRSIHGGVVGTLIEYAAEEGLRRHLAEKGIHADLELTTSSIEYLRVTKDAPLFARFEITRIARRIGFVEVWCWQDREDMPVSRGACTLRILQEG